LNGLSRLSQLILLITLVAAAPAIAEKEQPTKRPGQTIFGANKKATLAAMKVIRKSLGVKCTHCHIKKGGKVRYKVDTPNKEAARQMKFGFIDSLITKGEIVVEYPHDDTTKTVRAVYKAKGEDAGIYLSAIKEGEVTAKKKVELPKKGEALSCMTCHMGHTHIFPHAH
jgi:cytochrome c